MSTNHEVFSRGLPSWRALTAGTGRGEEAVRRKQISLVIYPEDANGMKTTENDEIMTTSLHVWLFLLLFFPSTTYARAPTTVVVTGAAHYDVQKRHLVRTFGVPAIRYEAAPKTAFVVFDDGSGADAFVVLDENFVAAPVGDSETNRTIVVASMSPAEMSLYELNLLHEILASVVGGIAIIELGEASPQTLSVARNSAFCWAHANFDLLSPHSVLLCNGVDFEDLRPLLSTASLSADGNEFFATPSPRSVFPCLFASATPTDKKAHRRHKSRRTIQPHGHRKLQQLRHRRRFGKKIDKFVQRQVAFAELSLSEKKLACRYRKSCYKTGQLPQLDFYASKLEDAMAEAQIVEDGGDVAVDIEGINELEVKLLCKYKPSCYSEIGLEMSEANRQKSASLLSGRGQTAPGGGVKKRRTLKEVAQIALRKVEEQEKQSAQREVPRSVIVEKKHNEIEEKRKEKVACRYRKSCYETGQLPETSADVPFFGFASGWSAALSKKLFGAPEAEKDFEEMEDADRKVHCKYRKSCYETGEVPEIEPEERFRYDDLVEMDEVPMQVRCKYRKSCYTTGIVPEAQAEKRRDESEETTKKKSMPMTLDHLRLMCKYRKSCYAQKAGEIEEDEEDASPNEEPSEAPKPVESKKKVVEVPVEQEEVVMKKAPKSTKRARKETDEKKETETPKKAKAKKKAKDTVAKEDVPQTPKRPPKEKKVVKEEREEELEVEKEKATPKKNVEERGKPKRRQVEEGGEEKKPPKKLAVEESEEAEEDVRSSCRYRKSCYESGVVPETEYSLLEAAQVFFADLYAKAMADDDEEQVEEAAGGQRWEDKSFEQRRVHCRYRKSCYENGVLPELERQTFETVIESIREVGDTVQLRCKYRKSCYDRERESVKEEAPKEYVKPKKSEPIIGREEAKKQPSCRGRHCSKEHPKAEGSKKAQEDDGEDEEEHEASKKTRSKGRKPRRPVDDDEKNMKEIPRPQLERRNLSTSEKLGCKYRISCYGTGQHIVITEHGKKVELPDEHKCKNRSAIYYLSCREILGLQPKERTPIGPNGRKLCRKKKTTEAA
ncbi:hypothetical protein QR680_012889 [Steinernema hermaphroditum]|uniref:Uncharacterized protein n=1 Tax=Steinernema hermaphroditum TaxID=289476 RepID=A0AA39I596_9BILA|nr:hypothetical protein QR680_012889 [Steinernema hermaphroditum]